MSSGSGEVTGLRLMTPREVAQVTGLQTFRVRQLIRERRLPAIRVGRTYRISEAALARFIAGEEAKGGDK